KVDPHDLLDLVVGQLGDVATLGDAGVVDEHVEVAEGVPHLEGNPLGALHVAQVGGPQARLRRGRRAAGQHVLEAPLPPGHEPDGDPAGGEGPGQGGADARGCAGDESGGAVAELHRVLATAFCTALRRSSLVTPIRLSGWCTSGLSNTEAMRARRSAASPASAPTRADAVRSSTSGGPTCMSPAIMAAAIVP